MLLALYGRNVKPHNIPYVQQLFDLMEERGMKATIQEDYYEELKPIINLKKEHPTFLGHKDIMEQKVDYLLSLGGDGTLLDTLTLVRDSDIPVLGINFGRLGFLANIGKLEIEEAIDALQHKTYQIDKRTMLHLESNKALFKGVNYALNEFSIHKKDTSAMITIHTYINGELLNSYWADGLIIATPTGSTGYSLSCGGPIIFPNSENFVITPVAPHNLNVRPIIVDSNAVISFEVEGRSESFLCTLDSRYETIDTSFQLAVRKEDFSISLIRLNDVNFMNTIRSKLMWGADQRN